MFLLDKKPKEPRTSMKFLEVMNELTTRMGIGRVSFDETGSMTLLFDGEHEVTFMPEEGGEAIFFQCETGDASRLEGDGCRALLEASFTQTDGAAFAIHHELDKVVLWKRFGEFASSAELEKAINDFLGLAVEWKKRLASGELGANGNSDAPMSSPSLFTSNFIKI